MLRSHRPLLLMGALIVLLFGYILRSNLTGAQFAPRNAATEPASLPGKNAITALVVRRNDHAAWTADFDYYYTGLPPSAALAIELTPPSGSVNPAGDPDRRRTYLQSPQRGAHHVSATIAYPGGEQTTDYVEVKLLTEMTGNVVLASQRIEQTISWPTFDTWVRDQLVAHNTPEANLKHAIELVDSGTDAQLNEAKGILDRLLRQNPHFDAAYVEMARVAMKTNWSADGVHQAEGLLRSALEINPHSANAKILLGYVYVHQRRFTQAETLFSEVAASNPPNLWLWANWGELLELQGKPDQAAAKYREAIDRPLTHDTYDRARAEAYTHLLAFFEHRRDFDEMETLYQKRISEFGPGSCYSTDYARFKLQVRGDTEGAIRLTRAALGQNCEDSSARQMLGLAEYVKWAAAPTASERSEALNQARIYLPTGPMALYLLADSPRTVTAAKALIASGEQIDQRDNEGLTALGHALQDNHLEAAKRLLKMGARADAPTGPLGMPLALLPVIDGNLAAVHLMREYGVDYAKLRFRGATALDLAKQSGNKDLLDALGYNSSAL